jgi:RNA 3'-phosphate cyclase
LIEIDGSYGEGGGQILRSAVALSVITKKPVKIINIRANRPNPGIKPQHFTAISIMKKLSNAEIKGLEIGSSEITFNPDDIRGGRYGFDVGTAGSIVLVFQTLILCCLKTKNDIIIELTGGTDVKWSPPWDYFENVFIPSIRNMGVDIEIELLNRGYYPKGGGKARIHIKPTSKINCINLCDQYKFNNISGKIHLCNLPEHVASRMKHAAIKQLLKFDLSHEIRIDINNSVSPGTGICLWARSDNAVIGTSGLGERGVSAERVGEKAAFDLIEYIKLGISMDVYLFDQLIPYMVLAKDDSCCFVPDISSHAKTNLWLMSHFFDQELFNEVKKNSISKVIVKGVCYR